MPPLTSVWTSEEDEVLRELVNQHGPKKWSAIAQMLGTKGSKQCRRRWKNYLNADLKKGGWSLEEDQILLEGHSRYGNKWTEIAKMVGGRTDNAVKNRWHAICKRGSKGGYSAWEEGVPGSVGRPKGRGGSKGGSATKSGGRVKARGRNDDDEDGSDDDDDEDDEDEDEEETDDDDEHGRGSRRKSVGVSGRKGRPPSTLKKQQLADQNLERLRQPSNLFMGSARPMAGGGGFTQMLQLPLNNDLEDPSQQPLGSAGGNYTGFLARSPRIANAVNIARSVLASTGSALFQPLAALGRSLNPFSSQASGEAQPPRQTNVLDLKRAPPAGFGGKRRPGGTAPALDLGGGVSVGPDGTRRDNSQELLVMMPGEHHVQGGAGGQLLYPPAKRQAFGGDFSQSRLQRSSTIRGTTPGGTPGTPLLTKLAMEAAVEREKSQSTSPGGGRRPSGLSIAIPSDGPSAPPAAAMGNFKIQVHKECLTSSEIQTIKEINEMGLPLYIDVSEDPPLTTSRREIEQTIFALNSPGGDADALNTNGLATDWMASLFSPVPSPLNPFGRSNASTAAAGSPRRLTRAALRESTGLTPRQSPKPGTNSAQRLPQSTRGGLGGGGSSLVAPSPSNAAVGVINSFQGLRDIHRHLLSKLITSAKVTEEEFLAHHQKLMAGAAGGPSAGPAGAGGSLPMTTRGGRSAQKALLTSRGGSLGLPSSSAFDFLNSTKGGGGGGYFDVLMTPSFPPDDLSMMLDVLNGFDTPRF